MFNTYIIIACISISTTAFCQQKLEDKARLIEEYYNKSYNNHDSIKYRKLFFEEFPNNFKELTTLYGFDQKGPLYYQSTHHILFLFNHLNCIKECLYYEKLINIAVKGKWDADAINAFQFGLREHVLKNPILTFELLKKKKDQDIKSFFFFFFDGIHPRWKEIPEELISMKNRFPHLFSLMEQSLREVLKVRGDGH